MLVTKRRVEVMRMSGRDRCDEILRMIDEVLDECELGAGATPRAAAGARDHQVLLPAAVLVVS